MAQRKVAWFALFALTLSAAARAETVELPALKSGDRWTYQHTVEKGPTGWTQTHEELVVTRATPSAIYYTARTRGSTQAARDLLSGRDWSRMRDINGKETVINRPFLFPLETGKSWDITYEEQKPNAIHDSERFETHYVVVGYETVTVPAGTFKALKVEADGHWHAVLTASQKLVQGVQATADASTLTTQTQRVVPRDVEGRIYKAFWYSPEAKRWVKSIEEYYSNTGVRNERYTDELESLSTGESISATTP